MLVALYSLKFTCCLFQNLLVTSCRSCLLQEITHYSFQKLLIAKDHLLQNSLVTRYRSCSLQKNHLLLIAKFPRYSLQKLFVVKSHLLLIAEVARSKISLATGCKIRSLLVAEVARCKNSLVSHCTANFDRYILCKVTTNKSQIQLNLVIGETI